MGFLVLEELELAGAAFFVDLALFFVFLFDGVDLAFELDFAVLESHLLPFEFLQPGLQFRHAMLRLDLLADAEGHGATCFPGVLPLVQRLVGRNRHFDLVSDSVQQQSSLGTVDRDLADDLVEALGIELLPNRTDAVVAGLALRELLLQFLSQGYHVVTFRCLVRHVLDVVHS